MDYPGRYNRWVTDAPRFDDQRLVGALAALPQTHRVAFAVAVAARLLGPGERAAQRLGRADGLRARELVAPLWSALRGDASRRLRWVEALEELLRLAPLPVPPSSWPHAVLDAALSAQVYAVRCLLTLDADEAAWAARCAYEAVEQAAAAVLGPGAAPAQWHWHAWVQRELQRQQRDLDGLRLGDEALDGLQQRAGTEDLFSAEETEALDRPDGSAAMAPVSPSS